MDINTKDISTKDRILMTALESFAEDGYNGTNLRDLSAKLGLSKSALYKHYESKEAIWDALLNRMDVYYEARFGSVENLPHTPKSCEELRELTMRQLNFTIHDPQIVMTRKLLMTEQFRNEQAARLATGHFLTGTEKLYTIIFRGMMEDGILKKDDPEMLAFSFTTPVSALIHLCDREPAREPEVMEKIRRFVDHIIETYRAE